MADKLMHNPYNKLKGKLRELGLTYSDIASALSISETAVGFKINGKSDFYISETEVIMSEFGIGLENFLDEKLRK